MAQHFLLSTKARTLSLAQVLRLSDQEAYDAFKAIRFADNGGEAFCPKCGCTDLYSLPRRKMWRCKATECGCQCADGKNENRPQGSGQGTQRMFAYAFTFR